jgi:hypothetical protein
MMNRVCEPASRADRLFDMRSSSSGAAVIDRAHVDRSVRVVLLAQDGDLA